MEEKRLRKELRQVAVSQNQCLLVFCQAVGQPDGVTVPIRDRSSVELYLVSTREFVVASLCLPTRLLQTRSDPSKGSQHGWALFSLETGDVEKMAKPPRHFMATAEISRN